MMRIRIRNTVKKSYLHKLMFCNAWNVCGWRDESAIFPSSRFIDSGRWSLMRTRTIRAADGKKNVKKVWTFSRNLSTPKRDVHFDASVVDYFLSWESDIDDSCKFSYVKKNQNKSYNTYRCGPSCMCEGHPERLTYLQNYRRGGVGYRDAPQQKMGWIERV